MACPAWICRSPQSAHARAPRPRPSASSSPPAPSRRACDPHPRGRRGALQAKECRQRNSIALERRPAVREQRTRPGAWRSSQDGRAICPANRTRVKTHPYNAGMELPVSLIEVPARKTLVVGRSLQQTSEIARAIRPALDRVYAHLKSQGFTTFGPDHVGHNMALYRGGPQDVEFGVFVAKPVAAGGEVKLSQTPAGRVATATHFGDYARLGTTYAALMQWVREHDYKLASVSWEEYG